MDIRVLKESNDNISKNTILSLLSDVFLKKVEDIRNFSPKEVYYKEDTVYRFNEELSQHELYACLKDGVTGDFNPGDWDDLIINLGGITNNTNCNAGVRSIVSIFQKTFTSSENTNVVPIEQQFDYTRDSITVFHSVYGLLSRDDYKVDDLGSSIRLRRLILQPNESITYFVYVGGSVKTGYNSIKQNVQYANKVNQTEFKIMLDYKSYADTLMVFNSVNIFIPPKEYTILNNKVILKEGLLIDEKLSMVVISKDSNVDDMVQIYQSASRVHADGIRNMILPFKNSFDTSFLVFHSLHGLITDDNYTTENGRILFKFDLNRAEELYYVVTSKKLVITNITESGGMLSVTKADIDAELTSHIIGNVGNVSLTKKESKKTVPLGFNTNTKDYDVIVDVVSADGDVGDIRISSKTYVSFDISFKGIAKNVNIRYKIKCAI